MVPAQPDSEADSFIDQVTGDSQQPVVMFAMEWCEFCWSVRKLFDRCAIQYQSVDIDSADYIPGEFGDRVRAALTARTGMITIPQVFVAGDFVGGCTDVFDEFKAGRFQERLAAAGQPLAGETELDPYTLLPGWLHPR